MTNQELSLTTSKVIYDYIDGQEVATDIAMETSLAYQIRKDIITTQGSPGTIELSTSNVIYDCIDEHDTSSDIVMEASPAYQTKMMATIATDPNHKQQKLSCCASDEEKNSYTSSKDLGGIA